MTRERAPTFGVCAQPRDDTSDNKALGPRPRGHALGVMPSGSWSRWGGRHTAFFSGGHRVVARSASRDALQGPLAAPRAGLAHEPQVIVLEKQIELVSRAQVVDHCRLRGVAGGLSHLVAPSGLKTCTRRGQGPGGELEVEFAELLTNQAVKRRTQGGFGLETEQAPGALYASLGILQLTLGWILGFRRCSATGPEAEHTGNTREKSATMHDLA